MNDFGLLENTHILKKNIEVFMILKKNWLFVSLEVEKNHQGWETVLVTKLCLRQKPKKHPLKLKFWKKKHDILDFWNTPSAMFLDCQK